MTKKSPPKASAVAIERLESRAAHALEELIEDTEKKDHVKVEGVDVALIPDAHGASPGVYVNVTMKKGTPGDP